MSDVDHPSTSRLVGDALPHATTLVSAELQLVRLEATEKVTVALASVVSIVVAGVVGLLALLFLLAGIVLAIANALPTFVACFIVGHRIREEAAMSTTYASAADAERHADKAREDLAKTLDQLKSNLTPRRLAGEAMAATRARTPDWMVRFGETARSPAGLGLAGLAAAGIVVTIVQNRRRPRTGERRMSQK